MNFKGNGANISKKRSAEDSADSPDRLDSLPVPGQTPHGDPHKILAHDGTYRTVSSLLEFFSRDVGFLIDAELRNVVQDDDDVLDRFEDQERTISLLADEADECFSRLEVITNVNSNLHQYLLDTLDRCGDRKGLIPSCQRIAGNLAGHGIKVTMPQMNQGLDMPDKAPVSSPAFPQAENRPAEAHKAVFTIPSEKPVGFNAVSEKSSGASHMEKRPLEGFAGTTALKSEPTEPLATGFQFQPAQAESNPLKSKLPVSGSLTENIFGGQFGSIQKKSDRDVGKVENSAPCLSVLPVKSECQVETLLGPRIGSQEPFGTAKEDSAAPKFPMGSFTSGSTGQFKFFGASEAPVSNSMEKTTSDNSGHQSLPQVSSKTPEGSTALRTTKEDPKTFSGITCPFSGKSMYTDTTSTSLKGPAPAPDSKPIPQKHSFFTKSEDELPSSAAAASFFASANTEPIQAKSNPFLQGNAKQSVGQAPLTQSWSAFPPSSFGKSDLLSKKDESPSVLPQGFDKASTTVTVPAKPQGGSEMKSQPLLGSSNPFLTAKSNPVNFLKATTSTDFQTVNSQLDKPSSPFLGVTNTGFQATTPWLSNFKKENQPTGLGQNSVPSFMQNHGSVAHKSLGNALLMAGQANESAVFADPAAEQPSTGKC